VDRVIVISQHFIVFHDLDIVNSLLSKNCRRGLGAGCFRTRGQSAELVVHLPNPAESAFTLSGAGAKASTRTSNPP